MSILNLKTLTTFSLLVLGLTVSACVPGQQGNTNTAEAPSAMENEKTKSDDGTVEQDDDAAPKSDEAAMEAEKSDDATMKADDEGTAQQADAAMQEVKTFDLTGKNFSFSQSEIKVKKGDKIKINFKSVDGFHDWAIDEFNAKTAQVNTGGTASVEFTADRAGTFEFYCSVGRHRDMGMVGKLIVE